MSPTQRTLKKLREDGWIAVIVERWNPFAKRRVDLFGGDILAVHPSGFYRPHLIQCTSNANKSARVKKVTKLPALKAWLASGCVFMVWGWSKKGKRGERKTWQVTSKEIRLSDMEV